MNMLLHIVLSMDLPLIYKYICTQAWHKEHSMKLWWSICKNRNSLEGGVAIKHEDGVTTTHYVDDPYLKSVLETHRKDKMFVNSFLHNVLIPIETAQGTTK